MSQDDLKPKTGRIRDTGRAHPLQHTTRVFRQAGKAGVRAPRQRGHISPSALKRGMGAGVRAAAGLIAPGTFDDGPWPGNTRKVLDALAQHCVKATFFPVGKHALWHPEILKAVAAAGHTIGSHTWSHANLGKLKGDKATEEIEKGFSAIRLALGAPPAPFFRFPYLQDLKDQIAYLGSRNIAIISHDLDSFDFRMHKPEDVIESVMTKLERKGKGIILMHDFQQATAKAMPDLLNELKAKGYKVVHMKAKTPLATLAQWDAAAKNEVKGAAVGTVPAISVVRTVEDAVIALPAKGPRTK